MDRAPGFEPGCWGFESLIPYLGNSLPIMLYASLLEDRSLVNVIGSGFCCCLLGNMRSCYDVAFGD